MSPDNELPCCNRDTLRCVTPDMDFQFPGNNMQGKLMRIVLSHKKTFHRTAGKFEILTGIFLTVTKYEKHVTLKALLDKAGQ